MLDEVLLKKFMNGFYGYGSFKAPFWFIGMEEGGGGSLDEMTKRLAIWNVRGNRELEDVAGYHQDIGITRHWDDPVGLQPTWGKLIRVLMSVKGVKPSQGNLREYQRDHLGRENDETCLLELMPLPSPGTSKWLYPEISTLPYLASRKMYLEEMLPIRIKHIRRQIASYNPPVILFYGLSYLDYWKKIAGTHFGQQKIDGMYSDRIEKTLFVVMKHPQSHGLRNDYFEQIGNWISSKLNSLEGG